MKPFFLVSLSLATALYSQDSSVTTRSMVDVNGHRVSDGAAVIRSKTASGSETTEKLQSINGRMVPFERVVERVLRDDSSGKVVERLITKYDQTGNPVQPLKQVIEEQKSADGSGTVRTSSYQGDVNGNMSLYEKSTTQIRKDGSTENDETTVEKPTVNGSFETVEKQQKVLVKDTGGNLQEESTTYRKDINGSFTPYRRSTTEHTQQGSEATDNTAEYEPNADGRMQLHEQTVAKTVTRADGSKEIERNVFRSNVPYAANDSTKLKLLEQEIVERKPAGDTVVETLTVRRPTLSDPNTLGPPRQISQTVCKGKCDQ